MARYSERDIEVINEASKVFDIDQDCNCDTCRGCRVLNGEEECDCARCNTKQISD